MNKNVLVITIKAEWRGPPGALDGFLPPSPQASAAVRAEVPWEPVANMVQGRLAIMCPGLTVTVEPQTEGPASPRQ